MFCAPSTADSYKWEACYNKNFYPNGSVAAGSDSDGSTIHVGRAKHDGHWIPAKVLHEKVVAYVPYGGKEHVKNEFEVKLFNTLSCCFSVN